jgi:branched-chain amino acid transport system permease protein
MRSRFARLTFTDIVLWLVGGLIAALVVIGSVRTLLDNPYGGIQWFAFIVSGLAQGSIYALIALGYTLVYGILRMINFAHSEVYMAGAFTGYFAAAPLNQSGFLNSNPFLGLLLVFLVAMGTSVLVAVLLERIAYRPLRRAPRLVPLITAIGASFFLQYTFRGLYGSNFKSYPEVDALEGVWRFGESGYSVQKIQVVVVLAAALLMVGLYFFVQRTRTGKAMRAVSEDKDAAALMGIDVDAIIVRTFILGAALAGAAGVLYALMFRQVYFLMGFIPGIKAFTAAVLGGIGNIPGAMLGGIFLGLFEAVGPGLILEGLGIPAAHQLKDVIAFTLLVLVLIFRPQGILGERLAKAKA